jgi:putative ABC transport system permease protein
MFRFTPYVIKSLWRHRARTLLTVSGAAVALFVLCFVGSVQEGLERLTEDEHAQRTLIVFQENRFCPTSSRLPQDYADRIRKMPGVKDVMPVLVWTNSCRSILDAVVFNGAPAQKLRSARDLRLSSGNWGEFTSRHDAALVGRNVAQRRKLTVGDQFSIGEISVKVAGVFGSSIAAEDNLIYTNLEFLQYTRGLNAAGLVTQHEVHLTDDAEPDALARAIDEALRAGPVATTTRRKGAFQTSTLSDLVDLIGFAHWLGYACVALVLSLVATTTVMSVQDRVREHACRGDQKDHQPGQHSHRLVVLLQRGVVVRLADRLQFQIDTLFAEQLYLGRVRTGLEQQRDNAQILPLERLLQIGQSAPEFRLEGRTACRELPADAPCPTLELDLLPDCQLRRIDAQLGRGQPARQNLVRTRPLSLHDPHLSAHQRRRRRDAAHQSQCALLLARGDSRSQVEFGRHMGQAETLLHAFHAGRQQPRRPGGDCRILDVHIRPERINQHHIRIAADRQRLLQASNEPDHHEDQQDDHRERAQRQRAARRPPQQVADPVFPRQESQTEHGYSCRGLLGTLPFLSRHIGNQTTRIRLDRDTGSPQGTRGLLEPDASGAQHQGRAESPSD